MSCERQPAQHAMSSAAKTPRQKRGRGRPRGPRQYSEADSLQVETEFRNRKQHISITVYPGGHVEEKVTFIDNDDDVEMPSSPEAADDMAQPSPPPLAFPEDYGDQWDGPADQGGQSAAEDHAHLLQSFAHCPLVYIESVSCACPASACLCSSTCCHVCQGDLAEHLHRANTCFPFLRQGVWCVPHFEESTGALSRRRFSMVHLRVICAGGEYRLVSWCSCMGTASVAEVLFSNQARALFHGLSFGTLRQF